MDNTPLVCVVIPVYNGARYIMETISSVLSQDYARLKVIVIDDGSADESAAIVESIANTDARVEIHGQANAGVAAARNAGFRLAHADTQFAMFVDQDDVLLPGAIANLAALLGSSPQCPAAHGDSVTIDQTGVAVPEQRTASLSRRRLKSSHWTAAFGRAVPCAPDEPTEFPTLIYSNCVRTTGQVLIRHSELVRVGGFDPDMVPVDDLDLYTRLSEAAPIAYLPSPVIAWRTHATNASRDETAMHAAFLRFLEKTAESPLTAPQRRMFRTIALYRVVTTLYALAARKQPATWRTHLRPYMAILRRSLQARQVDIA
jgi:alpha-1,3-rhamnosyltransferase